MLQQEEVKGAKRAEAIGFKTKQPEDTTITIATASILAKETRDSIVDTNSACSNKESRENECNNSMSKLAGRVCTTM